MSAAAGLLQIDDATPQSIVHTQNTKRPPDSCVPSTAIVRTLCVAMVISHLRARARFLVSLCRRRRRFALSRRLRLHAKNFLLSVTVSLIPLSLSLFLSSILVSRCEFSRPTPHCPAYIPFSGRIWCLLTGSYPPSRFPRWYASFGAMTVGTNGLTCGFDWQCTADAMGYVVSWSQHTWALYRLLTSTVWVHPGREAAGSGQSVWWFK